jgi:serine/threonine protein kinase
MENNSKPADRLLGCQLNDGWKVIEHYRPKEIKYSSCYIVQNGSQKGFLKAFDYSDIKKAGGQDESKRIAYKYQGELKMLQKCRDADIKSVIQLLANDRYYFKPNDLNELVEYFILEYSGDGNAHECLTNGNLHEFAIRFQALSDIFDGLHKLHLNGIMHLDLKAENILHFVKSRLTKITDFGSARQLIIDVDEDLLDELNSIRTTREYAPPECLYDDVWTTDWKEYRRKVDLYLIGNVIVKFFTNMSFTALLKDQLSESLNWNNPQNVGKGRLKYFLPNLITGASSVYVVIKRKLNVINAESGSPLDDKNILDLCRVIAELCNPDAKKRGHPKELIRQNDRDGLDRYRDKFITMRDLCQVRQFKK